MVLEFEFYFFLFVFLIVIYYYCLVVSVFLIESIDWLLILL